MCMYMNSFILFLIFVNLLLLTMYKKPQYSVIMILLSLVLFFMIIHYKNYRENFTSLEKIDNALDCMMKGDFVNRKISGGLRFKDSSLFVIVFKIFEFEFLFK